MNRLSHGIAVFVGVLWSLSAAAGNASAFFFCHKSHSTTYYAPAPVTACAPTTCCSPPPALVPVTVTTQRYGLFGLRQRTTVSYGAPVPVTAPVISAAPVFAPPLPTTSAFPPVFGPPGPGVIHPYP